MRDGGRFRFAIGRRSFAVAGVRPSVVEKLAQAFSKEICSVVLTERLADILGGNLFVSSQCKSCERISDAGTVYNFDTTDVDGKPEVSFKCFKRLVGERGFEPPTPWSRTRFRRLLNATELCRRQVIGVEGFAATALLLVDLRWASVLRPLQNRLHSKIRWSTLVGPISFWILESCWPLFHNRHPRIATGLPFVGGISDAE